MHSWSTVLTGVAGDLCGLRREVAVFLNWECLAVTFLSCGTCLTTERMRQHTERRQALPVENERERQRGI